jgi:polysaccharide export outer membrane protein
VQMAHRLIHLSLALATLAIAHAQIGIAQQTQPFPANQGGFPPVATSGRVPPTTARDVRNSELTVVPPDFADLKLAPGFLVGLSVLDDPDFEGTFRVDTKGDLALPILGIVHVAGETASEARQQISERLVSDRILKTPQVNLNVIEYAATEVTILGEVTAPGRYPLLAPRSLTDVLGLAGGLTIAAGNEIQITHNGGDGAPEVIHFSKATSPKAVQDAIVSPGETVQVKRAGIVYVLGAVNKPGGYVMQEDGTLTALEAISIANGTTLSASVGTIYLLRRNADGTAVRIALPLTKMQLGKNSDVQLRATDVLYVPTSKVKATLLNTQGILAAATSASIYAATIY